MNTERLDLEDDLYQGEWIETYVKLSIATTSRNRAATARRLS